VYHDQFEVTGVQYWIILFDQTCKIRKNIYTLKYYANMSSCKSIDV